MHSFSFRGRVLLSLGLSLALLFFQIFPFLGLETAYAAGVNYPLSDPANYDVRYDGATAGDLLPADALAIGDVNGDGIDDLVMGADWADYNGTDSGSVYVVFGGQASGIKDLGTGANYNIRYDGSVGSYLSRDRNIAIGDVNGDGKGDLIVGGLYAGNNGASSGSVWVIFSTLIDDVGATTGNIKPLSTSTNYNIRYDGPGGTHSYMSTIKSESIGDVNGDGLGDLILGTWAADYGGADSGSAWVMFSTLIDDVGTSTGNDKPFSTVGNYNIRYDGPAAGDQLTIGLSGLTGDVNGDGKGDLLFPSPGSDNNGKNNSGSYWVLLSTLIDDVGATTDNNLSLSISANYNIRYDGASADAPLKNSDVGDVNGDGTPDLILGAPLEDQEGLSSGSAWVMFSTLIDDVGTSTGNDKPFSTAGNYNIRIDGNSSYQLTNDNSIRIGDVNGDSFSDLILGAPRADSDRGKVYVLFSTLIDDVGSSTGNRYRLALTDYNIRFDGYGSSNQLSVKRSIAIADMNDDGNGDLVMGAIGQDYNGSNSGSVWIVYSTLIDDVGITQANIWDVNLSTSYDVRYDGAVANDMLGTNGLFSLGDVSGDGVDDLLMGSYLADLNGANSGSVWIVYGIPSNAAPADPSSLGSSSLVNGSFGADNTPALSFTLSDPDSGDQVKYQVQIDDNSDFSSPAVDYTSALAAQGPASFTVGQAEGSGTYTLGSAGQTLADGSYYWRVKTMDNSAAASTFSTANAGSVAFQVDATAPGDPGNLGSPSHTVSAWSPDNTIDLSWLTASDGAGAGVDGYSYLWDTNASTLPDAVKDAEETLTSFTSSALLDGDALYFHIRTVDNVGNWSSTAVHLGPFWIDDAAPIDPTALISPSHTVSTWSLDNTIDLSWLAGTDVTSGVDGYSYLWDTFAGTTPDAVKDAEETLTSLTSLALADGSSYYFHIRTLDNAGNWTSTLHLGPFFIDTAAPSSSGKPSTASPTLDSTPVWSWSTSSDAGSGLRSTDPYQIWWSKDQTFSSGVFSKFVQTASFTHAADLSAGTWYFRVQAFDGVGNSSTFPVASVLIQAPPAEVVEAVGTEETGEAEETADEEEVVVQELEDVEEEDGGSAEEPAEEKQSFLDQVVTAISDTVKTVVQGVWNVVRSIIEVLLSFFF
ncbi:MAG: hypothetical protein BMS9Abin34_126 [Patescibacteria group bacterium]|nr:MAG: hypothetical protein BMS9Abin34_126 [Patescibacteria group bacterium]